MKNAAILIVGIVIGYFLFSFFNPRPDENFTVQTRTIKQTNTVPVVVRDTRYHGQDAEIAPKEDPAVVNIKVEPVTETKFEILKTSIDQKKVVTKEQVKKEKSSFGFKTFVGLNQIPFLLVTDSKIKKILGQYNGNLKFIITARTGEISKANLKIAEDETVLSVVDAYDNIDGNYTFSRNTSEVFKTIPGDENQLMLITNSDSSFIFDLKALPLLKGKAYVRNIEFGEIELKKKQDIE